MPRVSAPNRLGRYPVRRRLGAGAFATVWLAYDEQLDSPVAIKVLADNWTGDDHVRQRFVEEGRFLRKVESHHVVSVYDAGELEDGRPFLVMSYADQGTLADRLQLAPLTLAQSVHVLRQVGQGLAELHEQSVLHRDVKPANVLFRTTRRGDVSAMLGDLGLGKSMDMSSRLTVVGGTPAYVSPEQARGEGLDGRSDQYSLAALTYLLLAGKPPYEHSSLNAAAESREPPSFEGIAPKGVEEVVLRGLSPDREQRYDSVADYVDALVAAFRASDPTLVLDDAPEAWIPLDPDLTVVGAGPRGATTRPVGEAPAEAPVRRPARRRALLAAAGAATLALGVVGGAVAFRSQHAEVTFTDAEGQISVTVPRAWGEVVADESWRPPGQAVEFPALSVGSAKGWNRADTAAPGIFAAMMPGEELVDSMPAHPECDPPRPAVRQVQPTGDSVTVVASGCRGADVVVERLTQVTSNQLLWVQVRADSGAEANRVLDRITLHGL